VGVAVLRALALNAGSSTLKAALYELDPAALVWEAQVGTDDAERLLAELPAGVDVVGHRVVHGGDRHRVPTLVTPELREQIAKLSVAAPLHNAAALRGIDAVDRLLGADMPQVAVFDTAFHADLPAAAYAYAGPYEWLGAGLRRFGFHGINHEHVAEQAASMLGRDLAGLRLITCHLGSGCSLAAVAGGRSVDTTMGFTPMEGLVMATRSGSVDPGLLLHLLRAGADVGSLDDLLNKRSGLAGLGGGSGDMRELLDRRERGDARACLAFDVYVHRLRREIGAMLGALGGLDAVVFTGGVGENAAVVRTEAMAPFAFLGAQVLVVPAGEEWAIAHSAARLAQTAVAAAA
jgi:acetate kinase